MGFSSVRPSPNSDGCSLEGKPSHPPVCPSRLASVHHPLPADWPVPQALHGPAYLSAETSSAVMAAVAVDSAAIVRLRWWASGRDSACGKNREFGKPETYSWTENGRLETPRGWALLYTRALRPAHPLPDRSFLPVCKLPTINFTITLYGVACLVFWSESSCSVQGI